MARRDSGNVILQALVLFAVIFVLVASMIGMARRSAKLSSTSASRSSLDELVLRAKLALADSNACKGLVVPSGGAVNPAGTTEVSIVLDPDSAPPATFQSRAYAPGNFTQTTDFTIESVALTHLARFASSAESASGTPTHFRYLAELDITAARRQLGGMGERLFLGAPQIIEQNPNFILLELNAANQITTCTTRSMYVGWLGPPGTANPKSALECIDRDGVPISVSDSATNNSYTLCRIAQSPSLAQAQIMFPGGCQQITNNGNPAGSLYTEGWRDITMAPGHSPVGLQPGGWYCY